MALWQRLLLTIVMMLAVSFGVSELWSVLLQRALPSYLSGLIGGLVALPVWEFLKRVGPRRR